MTQMIMHTDAVVEDLFPSTDDLDFGSSDEEDDRSESGGMVEVGIRS